MHVGDDVDMKVMLCYPPSRLATRATWSAASQVMHPRFGRRSGFKYLEVSLLLLEGLMRLS